MVQKKKSGKGTNNSAAGNRTETQLDTKLGEASMRMGVRTDLPAASLITAAKSTIRSVGPSLLVIHADVDGGPGPTVGQRRL